MLFNYIIIKINIHKIKCKTIRGKTIYFLSYDSLESETKIYGSKSSY